MKPIAHYGIQGQKWYQRRWQYKDGHYTPEGKERYFGSNDGSKSNYKKHKQLSLINKGYKIIRMLCLK